MEAKILIVEDRPDNAKLMRDALTFFGYQVEEVSTGRDALKSVEFSAPDLILMDIQLPGGLSGYDVIECLKKNEITHHIPIIAVTAYALTGDREKIMTSGCDDYLSKPFSIASLRTAVVKYITPPEASGSCVYQKR